MCILICSVDDLRRKKSLVIGHRIIRGTYKFLGQFVGMKQEFVRLADWADLADHKHNTTDWLAAHHLVFNLQSI
jgi:hypothetical protein